MLIAFGIPLQFDKLHALSHYFRLGQQVGPVVLAPAQFRVGDVKLLPVRIDLDAEGRLADGLHLGHSKLAPYAVIIDIDESLAQRTERIVKIPRTVGDGVLYDASSFSEKGIGCKGRVFFMGQRVSDDVKVVVLAILYGKVRPAHGHFLLYCLLINDSSFSIFSIMQALGTCNRARASLSPRKAQPDFTSRRTNAIRSFALDMP